MILSSQDDLCIVQQFVAAQPLLQKRVIGISMAENWLLHHKPLPCNSMRFFGI